MMLRFNSIKAQIIWLHVIALVAAAVAVSLAAYLVLNSTANELEDLILRAHANQIARHISQAPDGRLHVHLPADLASFYTHGSGGFGYIIIDQTGAVLSSLPFGQTLAATAPRRAAAAYFRSGSELGVSVPQQRSNRRFWVVIVQNLENPDVIVDNVVADFLRRVGMFTAPIVLIVLIADLVVVRRALRPVVLASEQARAIDPRRLELRLSSEDLPDEVVPLVEAINQALTHLEDAFRLQREFTADAAHELRTPLSVLRMRIDALEDQNAAGVLRGDIDAMSHVVDQLLAIAELEATPISAGETADLQQVCREVAELMAPIAVAEGRDLAITGCDKPVPIKGSPSMLFLAIRNLVENAIKHTPMGTPVEIDIKPEGIVRVLDSGVGVSEEERKVIFHRYHRGRRADTSGGGLGLAIVSRVVEAHSGSVNVENRPGCGAAFTLDLTNARVDVAGS